MAVTVLRRRESEARPPLDAASAEAARAFLRLADGARDVFASRGAFHDWFACVLHHRAHGEPRRTRAECDEVSALACAMSFRGECLNATASRDLDTAMRRLPTARLEALLRVCGERPAA